jgi:hypothetical protein
MTDSEQDWAELEQQRRTFREHLLLADGFPLSEGYRRNRTARVAPA